MLGDLTAIWSRIPTGQKAILVALGGGAIALFMMFSSWSGSPDFVPLYTALEPGDAAAIVDRLQAQGIPHQLSESGTTIRVPSAQVAAARLDLAAEGLPAGGGVGFEIFDNQSFGVTDFVQRINLRRSLEGELTRTINQLDSVTGSRVHIALPESQLFSDQQGAASASVVLEMRAGSGLSQSQVRGVAHLVAQSVDGLNVDSVTILNTKGDILFDGSEDLGVAGSTQLQLTDAFETRLENDLSSFLRSVLGPNRSAVEVSAVLDFTQTETTRETFTPITEGERSTQTVTETFSGSNAAEALNVGGAVANVPGLNAPEVDGEADGTTSSYSRSESTINNELDRTLTVTANAPGDILQLSISVILDESVTPEQATALESAISAAAGINTARGDSVTVTQIPFDTTELEEAALAIEADAAAASSQNMMRMAIPVVAVLMAAAFLWFFSRKIGKARGGPGADQLSLSVGGGAATALAASAETVEHMQERIRREEQLKLQEQETQEITQFVRNQPQAVAEVVQTWVREDG